MDYKVLSAGLPLSSRLAFGCSGIMGRLDKQASIQAIHRAYDLGITHFDVAPSYGYGEAEACLGEAIQHNRHKIVLATKFGIAAAKANFFINYIKPIARRVAKYIPSVRSVAKHGVKYTGSEAISIPFTNQLARISLENSLKSLKTDYLDIFLLHECGPSDITDDMLSFLEEQVKAGKILSYGIASHINSIIHQKNLSSKKFIAQFSNNIFLPNYPGLLFPSEACITHSAFNCSTALAKWLKTNKTLLSFHSLEVINHEHLYEIMLLFAMNSNPHGIIISSMLNEKHLIQNIKITNQPKFSSDQIFKIASLINNQEVYS